MKTQSKVLTHERIIVALQKAAGKNDIRHYLNNVVFVKGHTYIATNSHIYAKLTLTPDNTNIEFIEACCYRVSKNDLGKTIDKIATGNDHCITFDKLNSMTPKEIAPLEGNPSFNSEYFKLAAEIIKELGEKFNKVKLGRHDDMLVLQYTTPNFTLEIGIMPLV